MNILPNDNFLHRLKQIVAMYPDNIAVWEDGIKKTTYQQLWAGAHQVALWLQNNCHGDRVGIAIEKSAAYVMAVLGCWIAKKTFVPFDMSLPVERLNYIKENAELDILFTKKEFVLSLSHSQINPVDFNYDIAQDYPAYIIYTSGTTGTPKGVMVSHNGIVNLADNQIKAFKTDNQSVYLFYVSVNFDAHISDMSVCLLSGATLVVEHGEKLSVASSITKLIRERRITHMDIPPSLLKLIPLSDIVGSSLQTVVIGGEPCNIQTVQEWAKVVNLVNVYGPTEATVCTSLNQCGADWSEPLIGTEIDNIEYQIADDSLNIITNGSGELLIAGVGLALGYVNNPELTDRKFIHINGKRYYRTGDLVVRLPDGNIKFLGRIDRQVKIRGQLVELEEIENRLNAYPDVTKGIVLKREIFTAGYENLVAFIEPVNGNMDIDALKTYLKTYLPTYMIPIHFEIVSDMPLTASGKINQKALYDYKITKIVGADETNLTPNEKVICDAFRKVLCIDDLSADDSFTACGGDSLNIIEAVIVCADSGIELNPELIFQKETAREIAKCVTKNSSSKRSVTDFAVDIHSDNDLPIACDNFKRENALITGTTGFLGSKLLLELLETTDYTFYCLIRARSEQYGFNRLRKTLTQYHYILNEQYKNRIRIVCGDIGLDCLGMTPDLYRQLSKEIDVVYHCAAQVNMIATYEQLKNTNLNGTKRIVQFCCAGVKKVLHYASTLSVFVSTDDNCGEVFEDDKLNAVQYIYGGYGQTKYASEKYLLNIPQNVCDVFIYRFGLITGDTVTGISAQNDFLGMFMKGAHTLGILPKDDSNALAVDITPIDYAAQTMAKISVSNDSRRIFHIANSKPLNYNRFARILKDENIITKITSYNEWKSAVDKRKDLDNCEQSCVLALCRLNQEKYESQRYMDLFQATHIRFNTQNTNRVVKTRCPAPTDELIAQYIHRCFQTVPTTGLVLGKFLPPHKGHQYLLDCADSQVDKLYIVVDNTANDIIPVSQRIKWMQALYPKATVVTLKKELPQYPHEAPADFWVQWQQGLLAVLPEKIDYVFASEDYGEALATVLGAYFKMVDKERATVPICATKIRENPIRYWDYIVDVAKPYFVKKVCVFGPESTGKSTLTQHLANLYHTTYVSEYAQELIERKNGKIQYEDMEQIVVGHYQDIENKIQTANKLLFVDTDAIISKIWSTELFGKYPAMIDTFIKENDFDLYLLLDVDVPWVDDIHRFRPDNRNNFFKVCQNELVKNNCPFKVISGNWSDRLTAATTAVNDLIDNSFLKQKGAVYG